MNKIKRDSDVSKMYDMLLVLKKQCNEFNNFSIGKLLFKCGYNNKKNIVSALESLNVISVERSKNNKNLYYWTYKGRISHFDARTILYRIFDLNSGKKLNKCVDPLIEAEPIVNCTTLEFKLMEKIKEKTKLELDKIELQKEIAKEKSKVKELSDSVYDLNKELIVREIQSNILKAEINIQKKYFKIRKSIVYVVLTLLFYILAFTYALFYHNLI